MIKARNHRQRGKWSSGEQTSCPPRRPGPTSRSYWLYAPRGPACRIATVTTGARNMGAHRGTRNCAELIHGPGKFLRAQSVRDAAREEQTIHGALIFDEHLVRSARGNADALSCNHTRAITVERFQQRECLGLGPVPTYADCHRMVAIVLSEHLPLQSRQFFAILMQASCHPWAMPSRLARDASGGPSAFRAGAAPAGRRATQAGHTPSGGVSQPTW